MKFINRNPEIFLALALPIGLIGYLWLCYALFLVHPGIALSALFIPALALLGHCLGVEWKGGTK